MATSIEPNSEMRTDYNIRVGYGEVPGYMLNLGIIEVVIYGLPDGKYTFDPVVALEYADKLNVLICKNMTDVNQLMRKHMN